MKNLQPIDGRSPGGFQEVDAQEVDKRIDATLRLLARVEPPAGLAGRVEETLSQPRNGPRSGRGSLRSRIAASGIAASLIAGGLIAGIAFHSRQAAPSAPQPVVHAAPPAARPSTGMSTSGLIRMANPPAQAAPRAAVRTHRHATAPVRRGGALPRGVAVPRTPVPPDAPPQRP